MKFSESKPIYKQIIDHICRKILKKEWEAGNRIPSVREVAVQMEVNPNTAMRAFQYLQEEGILDKKRGVGHFISGDAHKNVLALKRAEFMEKEVPRFFRKMELLGYTCQQLNEIYHEE